MYIVLNEYDLQPKTAGRPLLTWVVRAEMEMWQHAPS